MAVTTVNSDSNAPSSRLLTTNKDMPRPNVKPRPVCRYYNTPRGCFAGNKCHYCHGDPVKQKYAPVHDLSRYKNGTGSNMLWSSTRRTKPADSTLRDTVNVGSNAGLNMWTRRQGISRQMARLMILIYPVEFALRKSLHYMDCLVRTDDICLSATLNIYIIYR